MRIHSTLKRFACLTVLLAVSASAFEAQAGGGMKGGPGLKVGSAVVLPNRNQVQTGATAVLPGSGASGQYVRPTGANRPGCGKRGCSKR
jgi:hypothetical protein